MNKPEAIKRGAERELFVACYGLPDQEGWQLYSDDLDVDRMRGWVENGGRVGLEIMSETKYRAIPATQLAKEFFKV